MDTIFLDKVIESWYNKMVIKFYKCGFFYGMDCNIIHNPRGKECPYLLPYSELPEDRKKYIKDAIIHLFSELEHFYCITVK